MTQLDELRHSLAEALSEDPEQIRATNPKWINLMKEGVLVSLHIGRWRAKTRLTWSDLGLELDQEADSELQNIIDLGHKKLLPASVLKELDSIESAARKWLEKKSYRTYWGFFVPVTLYEEWKQGNEEQRQRYFAARDALVNDYDEVMKSLVYGYRLAARSAYNRLKELSPEKLANFKNEDAFTETFIEGIKSHLWDATAIRESFYFNTELHYIPLPSLLAEEAAEQQRLQDEAAAEHQRLRDIMDTAHLKAENERRLEREQFQAQQDRIWAETRAAQSAAQWKEQLMKDMHKDVIEKTRKQKEKLVGKFLKDLVVQLRSLVYDATTDVLQAIQDNNRLHPRSVVQLRNLVDQVKGLNFQGDTEIERMIAVVQSQLNRKAEDRDLSEIEAGLRDIAIVVRSNLIGLGERPRSARGLGVADEPAPEAVSRARRGLGLETEAVAVEMPTRRQARVLA